MYTRRAYLNHECDFDTYYGQFVTDRVAEVVLDTIGIEPIMRSKCHWFSEIALWRWDKVPIRAVIDKAAWKSANGTVGMSQSDVVCVAKAAAAKVRTAELPLKDS